MGDISSIGIATAVAAGTASFLSPCVLPLVPGYLSYVAGHSISQASDAASPVPRIPTIMLSLSFVLGFSTVFILLGASATVLGQLLLRYRYETNIAGGILIMVFGLFMTGLVKLPWLEKDARFHGPVSGTRPIAAYLLGIAFGFGWTPCIGPILGAILVVSATTTTLSGGIALLGAYSLGLAIPFVAAAAFTGAFMKKMKTLRRFSGPLRIGAGVIMILMGIAMITGQLTVLSLWLLNTFPQFASVG